MSWLNKLTDFGKSSSKWTNLTKEVCHDHCCQPSTDLLPDPLRIEISSFTNMPLAALDKLCDIKKYAVQFKMNFKSLLGSFIFPNLAFSTKKWHSFPIFFHYSVITDLRYQASNRKSFICQNQNISYTTQPLGGSSSSKKRSQVRLIQKRISKYESGSKVTRASLFIKVSKFYYQCNVFKHCPFNQI